VTTDKLGRRLAKALGTFHNVSYYAPEMKAFADLGLPQYWRAYMAYRSAPMGIVPWPVVASTFYNFAPVQVQAGIPSAWGSTTPDEAMALRDDCISRALLSALGDVDPDLLEEAAELALRGIASCEAGARPLFAAHRELAAPTEPLMRLWFGCTLWREHRGDGHNIALAAAEIDGVECHVLLAARGIGDKDVIRKIRGWSEAEWDAALDRLVTRELLTAKGEFTPAGRELRSEIERHTDRLAAPPLDELGAGDAERLADIVEPLVGQLITAGVVAGKWPPKVSGGRPSQA